MDRWTDGGLHDLHRRRLSACGFTGTSSERHPGIISHGAPEAIQKRRGGRCGQ